MPAKKGDISDLESGHRGGSSPVRDTEEYKKVVEAVFKRGLQPGESLRVAFTKEHARKLGIKHPEIALKRLLEHEISERKLPYVVSLRQMQWRGKRPVLVIIRPDH